MADRPNILFIDTHDTGRHLGCYGVGSVVSPNLDRFASESVRFTNFFAASALCSPSRGAAMTGRYPQRNGMLGLCHAHYRWRLNEGEKHLSHLLHDAGYCTVLLGHQHETTDIGRDLCFDRHGLHQYPDTWEHVHGPDVATGVCEFLAGEAAGRAPFYLQVGFFETHRPFNFGGIQPDSSKGVWVPPYLADTPKARGQLADFQGNIRAMDECVGRILDTLDTAGLAQNTIVVFTTDHGIDFPRAKTTLYDPGTGISLMVRWPGGGLPAGAVRDQLVANVDLVPTLLELAGVALPDNLDGDSQTGLLRTGGRGREHVFTMMQGHGMGKEMRAVRTATHKLIRNFEVRREARPPVSVGDDDHYTGANRFDAVPHVELYDLRSDPNEFTNLAGEKSCAALRDALDAQLWRWLEQVSDPVLAGPVATPFYLQAREAYRAWDAAGTKE